MKHYFVTVEVEANMEITDRPKGYFSEDCKYYVKPETAKRAYMRELKQAKKYIDDEIKRAEGLSFEENVWHKTYDGKTWNRGG